MVYNGILEGKYVNLRSVEEKDAEFTLSLRQDPILTKYLPKLDITLEQQINWIRKQRVKEGDFYFLVENKDKCDFIRFDIYPTKIEEQVLLKDEKLFWSIC